MNLLVFLSDLCNMSCDYCFLALNTRPATILKGEDGRTAIERHLSEHGEKARVTLLGGEPLLHPELVHYLARVAREGGAKVTLVTNGTRAEPMHAELLARMGVELCMSVDGPAPVHDRHRRMLGGQGSHERVQEALAKIKPADWRVNLVLSEDTAGQLLSSAEWLRARGFRRMSFHADVRSPWSEAGHARLLAALAGFTRYARALKDALALWHLDSFRAPGPVEPGDELVLGADGRYYVSDAYLSKPYGQGLEGAIGDVGSGPDRAKRFSMISEAAEAVKGALEGRACYTPPLESCFLARVQGRDPVEAVRAFHRADTAIGDALSALARECAEAGR